METLQIVGSLCLHALALAVSVAALLRTRHSKVSAAVRFDLERIEARSLAWKSSALTVKGEVESAIDRLESKRRSLAAVESRLAARENHEEVAEEIERSNSGARVAADDPDIDRATARRLRREQVAG